MVSHLIQQRSYNNQNTNPAPPKPTHTSHPWKNVHFALANTDNGSIKEHLLFYQVNNANNLHMHATVTTHPIKRMTHHSLLFLIPTDDIQPTRIAPKMIMTTTPMLAYTTGITMHVSYTLTMIMKAMNMTISKPMMNTRMKANNQILDELPIWAPTVPLNCQVYMLLAP